MSQRFTGYSHWYHDAALSIINEDGTVEFASHAERFSGRKNDLIIPDSLWAYKKDTDHLSFYEDSELKQKLRKPIGQILESEIKLPPTDLYVGHHISHCAGAFYTRPWTSTEDTVMVSIDGVGEHQTAVILDHKFNILREWHYPKSVGLVYTHATKSLGLKPLEDEYVVMGLSSYGEVDLKLYQWLHNWYRNTPDHNEDAEAGHVIDYKETKGGILRAELQHVFNSVINRKEVSREDFAATIQAFADWAIMDIMNIARQYGKKLVYSGGCAQNVVINSKLPDLFDEVHIAVSPTDAGSSLGCAAYAWGIATGGSNLIWTPYLGYNIDREVNPSDVVDHLLEHKVCGLANGRAEFGPRALGNRSLIADVRYDVKDTVNDIKRRQKYRPFAPAILEEYVDEYFDGYTNEYMQYTCNAKHDYKSVTHVDGTARVQVVKKDCQSIFRKVIEEYFDRTGVPMLLNTSLNIRGRPMVNNEHDARLWEQKYKVKVF
jgi:carbamoyltransferase